MAKRKRASRTGMSVKEFVIPALLKTEPIEVPSYPPALPEPEEIEVDIKPEIFTPCKDSKSSNITISSDNILTFKCDGCGQSGVHHFGSEYRLVKTAMLVQVGTQTGDDSNSPEIPVEASKVPSLDGPNNPVSVPTSSAASPSVVSSDNGKCNKAVCVVNWGKIGPPPDSIHFHLTFHITCAF